ncbi:MAG TPA: bifunctional YncE family protein/alkaline phosphatase family protein [Tepidisphaeraceae bacterium]|jgi:YVTN family beta-propeller protein|nr:bifunctional YncE family protein/alkaline phosphatase family protein [Tepidisphaeraceae bacterium]
MKRLLFPIFASAALLLVSPLSFAKKHLTSLPPTGPDSATTTQPSTLFNGWGLTPAGSHIGLESMPLKLLLSPDQHYLAAVCGGHDTGLGIVDLSSRQLIQWIPLSHAWNGLAFSKDGHSIYVSGGNTNALNIFSFDAGHAKLTRTYELEPTTGRKTNTDNFFAGIAVQPTTGNLFICNEGTDEVWQIRPSDGHILSKFRTGEHPHSCVFGYSPRYLLTSNWGSRSVSIIDTNTGRTVQRIQVGIRPNDMALAPDGRLFVSCAGDNTVHVIQTKSDLTDRGEEQITELAPPPATALEIISTSLYPNSPEGSSPSAVSVSPDGHTLFVVNSDNNDVAVVDISHPDASVVEGFVPTGWYPTAVATDGHRLFVANGKGLGNLGPNIDAPFTAPREVGGIKFNHPTGLLEGSISFIDEPTQADLAKYTDQVRKNSPYTPDAFLHTKSPSDSIIPSKVGDPCPIKYILYVIKENRTYDQVFGDMTDASGKPWGNGDPKLTFFGEDVSPNHHQLARDYVLLDNLYCNSEVSYDGHSWCDGAIATDFRQRAWTVRYTGHGLLPGNDDMENPAGGYLWDLCKRHGLPYKSYGEMVKLIPSANRGTWSGGRDMNRIDGWIKDLHDAEKNDSLPRLMVMSLGEDHTRGTAPGQFTPQSHVASNDIAVGKIVEAASRSKFWNQMAIFIIEDDAQNGPDHVDSHRTVGLVISPWIKQHTLDSTPYTTASMVRTMELILGLPPMTQYDAGATPMFNCFAKVANPVPYVRLTPKVDLNAKNTKDSPGAAASAKMDFDEWDEAPEDELNRVLWLAIKGPNVPYQLPIHRALFTQ